MAGRPWLSLLLLAGPCSRVAGLGLLATTRERSATAEDGVDAEPQPHKPEPPVEIVLQDGDVEHYAENFDKVKNCIPENRKAAMLPLKKIFNISYAHRVQKYIRNAPDEVFITMGEGRSAMTLTNFLLHLRNVVQDDGVDMTIVYVSLDVRGYGYCKTESEKLRTEFSKRGHILRLECVSLAGWLPSILFEVQSGEDVTRGQLGARNNQAPELGCIYNFMIWTKPLILQAALDVLPDDDGQRERGVFMVDTDVLFRHDLRPYVHEAARENPDAEIITGHDNAIWRLNTGTTYVTKRRSARLVSDWVWWNDDFLTDQHGDQGALEQYLYRWWFFHRRPRSIKKLFKIPREKIGQCGLGGSIATHYNCVNVKRTAMLINGDWLLPDEAVIFSVHVKNLPMKNMPAAHLDAIAEAAKKLTFDISSARLATGKGRKRGHGQLALDSGIVSVKVSQHEYHAIEMKVDIGPLPDTDAQPLYTEFSKRAADKSFEKDLLKAIKRQLNNLPSNELAEEEEKGELKLEWRRQVKIETDRLTLADLDADGVRVH